MLAFSTRITAMKPETGGTRAGLYRLLAWSSPAFPIGAFSYSHGLEADVAIPGSNPESAIHDRASLQQWVAAIVLRGSGRIDADILRDAYRAAERGAADELADANHRGLAYRATAELALESGQQGEAFLRAWQGAWQGAWLAAPHPGVLPARGESVSDAQPRTGEGLLPQAPVCHAAALGAAAASAGITLEDALLAYLQSFAGNLVSAGIRLGIIGQTDGQRILAALEPEIVAAVGAAMNRSPAEFGGATFAADIGSMAHETQYTRLFRS